MIVNEQIEKSFGKWIKYFRPFVESEAFDKIFAELKKRKGTVRTCPDSSDVFRCFRATDPDHLKCILVGIAPYHTFTESDPRGICVADGLMMSCSKTKKEQPSLTQLYDELIREYQYDQRVVRDPDLSGLALQGVLLYNVALTVQENKPCSDNSLWSEFDKFFWEKVINVFFRGLPCVFMGQQCHKSANYLTPMLHYPICISHPASASYNNTQWSSEGAFKKVDQILRQNNNSSVGWMDDLPF